MGNNKFTASERRGLLILLVLVAITICWTLFSKTCHSSTTPQLIQQDTIITSDQIKPLSDDSTSIKKQRLKRQKKDKKSTNKLPDGRQRDLLDEKTNG